MAYEFQSKYKKTNTYHPEEKNEHHHPCCHPSHKEPRKKEVLLSSDKPSGEYTYNSPYTQSTQAQEENYCCHHEDFHHEACNLQEKNAEQRQKKSIDLIRKKLEEESQRKQDLEDKNAT